VSRRLPLGCGLVGSFCLGVVGSLAFVLDLARRRSIRGDSDLCICTGGGDDARSTGLVSSGFRLVSTASCLTSTFRNVNLSLKASLGVLAGSGEVAFGVAAALGVPDFLA